MDNEPTVITRLYYKLISSFCLILFMTISVSYAQNSYYQIDRIFSPDELQEDFDLLVRQIQNIHPTTNLYTSKQEFDEIIAKTKIQLQSEMTELEFYVVVQKFIKHIRCGHTISYLSKNFGLSHISNPHILPLDVFILKEKLFIKSSQIENDSLSFGTEITAINGIKSQEIISNMREFQQTDGYNVSFEKVGIELKFKYYLMFLYGLKESYKIEFLDTKNIPQQVIIEKQKSIAKTEQSSIFYSNQNKSLNFNILEEIESTAYLDIDKFHLRGSRDSYNKIFKKLYNDNIENLILDLRGNSGGALRGGIRLLYHLTNKEITFKVSKKRFKLKYMNSLSDLSYVYSPPRRKTYSVNKTHQLNKKLNYKNKLFVLIDGGTFSCANFIATHLKYHRPNTIFIGEETGGTEIGSSGYPRYLLTLKNTKLRVIIPMVLVKHDAKPVIEGRGVIPDIPIEYKLSDMLEGKDLEMEKVKSLINQN